MVAKLVEAKTKRKKCKRKFQLYKKDRMIESDAQTC